MHTTHDISLIVKKIVEKVEAARQQNIFLRVGAHKLDDEWLFVEIQPDKAGVRASEHALLMSRIEQELEAEGIDRVILVPALEE